ncbi:MAG: hypothetical protein ACXVB1_09580 [Pseudobdellovibrionaceae bacterium]
MRTALFYSFFSLFCLTGLASPPVYAQTCSEVFILPLFQNSLEDPTPVNFQLYADFKLAKTKNPGGNWTGEDQPFSKFGVPLIIKNAGLKDLKGFVKVRGMSSVGESKFPKLKIKLDEAQDLNQSYFSGIKGLRIITSGFNNEPHAPYREALAYEMAKVLELQTPKFQRAKIDYFQQVDKTQVAENVPNEQEALLIENDKSMLKRTGMIDVSSEYLQGDVPIAVDLNSFCKFFLFHSLIINEDFGLRVRNEATLATEKNRPLFNTMLLKNSKTGSASPLVYDLNKSQVVGIYGKDEKGTSLLLERPSSEYEVSMLNSLSRLRQKFTPAEIDSAIGFFRAKLDKLQELVDSRLKLGLVDPKGAANAHKLLDYFKRLSLEFTKLPITLAPTKIYTEPKEDKSLSLLPLDLSDEASPLPPGTPVRVLGTTADGKFLKVAILDTHYHIISTPSAGLSSGNNFNEYIGYINATAPIGNVLPESELGYTSELDMYYK